MLLKKPNFYPATYLVMTVTSLLATAALTGLVGMLVHYWINGVSDILNDTIILYWIASLLVVTPIHLLAYKQVRATDKKQVTTFSVRFANGLLGAYLFVVVGSFILLSTWLIAVWLNAFFGTGTVDKNIWAATISLVLTLGWLAYIIRHFIRSRANESRPKYYIVTVSVVSAIVLALSVIFPVMAYGDVARDFKRSSDLEQINGAIGEYVDAKSALPGTLSDLSKLDDDAQQRLSDYEYTPRGETQLGIFGYTLCGTFARSNEEGRDVGIGFTSHGAGKQCFTRTTISITKLNTEVNAYFKGVNDGAAKLQTAIKNFLLGAGKELGDVESFAGGQVKQLESTLEGVEGGRTGLQSEMQRLAGDLTGLEANTGDLDRDMAAVQAFLHDLGCLFEKCSN